MLRALSASALTSALLLTAGAAHAGGYYVSDVGVRGVARGGAFVAAPDSVLAIHYNPAALSLLRGLHLQGDLKGVNYDMTFERSCPCLVDPSVDFARENETRLSQSFEGNPDIDQSGTIPIPFVGLAYGFDWQNLTIGFAAYGPTSLKEIQFRGGGYDNTRNSPARYGLTNLSLYEAFFTLGVAIEPIKGLRVGGTAAVWQFGTKQGLHLYANTILNDPQAENSDWDIPTDIDVSQDFALNWGLGVSWDTPLDGLSIGGSVLGKRSVRAEGTATINLPPNFGGEGNNVQLTVDGDQIELETNLPPIWRAGIQYKMEQVFTAEAAFVYEAWQVHKRVVIRPQNIRISGSGPGGIEIPETVLGQIEQERQFNDTASFRLGGEFTMFQPYFGAILGYYFETSAVADEFLGPGTPDFNKHGLSAGLNTTIEGFRLDIMVQNVLMNSRETTDSDRQITSTLDPPIGTDEYITRTGNGRYDGSYFNFGASLSFALDTLLGT